MMVHTVHAHVKIQSCYHLLGLFHDAAALFAYIITCIQYIRPQNGMVYEKY